MKNSSLVYKKSISSIKWNYLGVFARIFMQLVIQTYMARKIGPEEYGAFAAIVLLTGIVCILIEAGVGALIIKSNKISLARIKNLIALNFLLAIVFSVLLALIFNNKILNLIGVDKEVSPYLISSVLVFYSFSCVPTAMLKKMFLYKQMQVAQNLSYAICFGVVGFLIIEFEKSFLAPLCSLVLFNITYSLALLLALNNQSFEYTEENSENLFLLFGGVFSNVQNWIIENIDNYLIGRLMGSVALGYYAVSYNFVRSPANSFVATFQSVAFSAFSAVNEKKNSKIVDAYCVSIALIVCASSFLFGFLFLISDYVILFFYGNQWIYAASVLKPLALAMIFHSVMAVAGPLLVASGGIKKDILSQSIAAFLMALAIYAYCSGGGEVAGAAWVVCGVYFFRCLIINIFVAHHFELNKKYIFVNVVPVFLFLISFSVGLFFVEANKNSPILGIFYMISLWCVLFLTLCFFPRNSIFAVLFSEKFINKRFK